MKRVVCNNVAAICNKIIRRESMKSIKKVLAVLFTAILVIGLIACSKDTTES